MRAQDPMTEEQTGHRGNTLWLKITERSMKLESNESHLSELWGRLKTETHRMEYLIFLLIVHKCASFGFGVTEAL